MSKDLDWFHIDLETLGTDANSVIIALGAVAYNPYTGEISDRAFYSRINVESNKAVGRTVSQETLEWWEQQSEAARELFNDLESQPDLPVVLDKFESWLESHCPNVKDRIVVGNGAAFDNTMLSDAYLTCERTTPWAFWNDHCYRTVKNLMRQVTPEKRVGVHHNALDDALHQAKHHVKLMQYHRQAMKLMREADKQAAENQ